MLRVLLIIVLVVFGIPAALYLFWSVHCALDRLCMGHARRYCRRRGLEISRVRCQPAFDQSGVKTESSLVQLDCFDARKERRLVLLVAWPFGVRKMVSDESYPESYDVQWPQPCA